ncbi:MAG: creatininase [Succinivibrio sp.]|nr:creatininase [Succinivibrio sp.]MCI6449751.1 creatininase [Succinivibrio sp.]
MKIMHHLTRVEFENNSDKVVVLPIGSTEQHGPHLPLGVDSYIAEDIAKHLAKVTDIIIAPTITYGYKSKPLSGGGPLFKGTIDLNGETLIHLVTDILCEFARDGFNKIFIENAHFENQAFIEEAMDLATAQFPKLKVVQSNWWDVLDQKTVDEIFKDVPFPGWALEHAAITETSLMMYLEPDLVRTELMPTEVKAQALPYSVYPARHDLVPDCGVLASPVGSTKEKGKLIVDKAIEGFIKIFKKEFN